MNAQELFEHMVYKGLSSKAIQKIFLRLSNNNYSSAYWDYKWWAINSYDNSDDITVEEFVTNP